MIFPGDNHRHDLRFANVAPALAPEKGVSGEQRDMPYIVVNDLPVFLHTNLWNEISKKALAHKSAEFRLSSMIQGQSEVHEADRLIRQYINDQYDNDTASFENRFVHFDLTGKSAQENAWNVLHDYCDLFKCGWTSDTRDTISALVDDYGGNGYVYPQGRSFSLILGVRPVGLFSRFIARKLKPTTSIVIECENALRIAGDLSNFKLSMKHMEIHCRDGQVIISPPSKDKS